MVGEIAYTIAMKQTILLVEDDAMIAQGLEYALVQQNYDVTHCSCLAAACAALQAAPFDLAILDMQLPDGTGAQLHAQLNNTIVIYLTVVDDEGNIVRAFEQGAADYVTKPFRLGELLARIKRALNSAGNSTKLAIGEALIDTAAGKVYVGEEMLELTALEYRLLLTFAAHKNQLLTRAQILEHIWDASGSFVEDNTLTVYVKRLREKLGDAVQIETVRGIGYRVD